MCKVQEVRQECGRQLRSRRLLLAENLKPGLRNSTVASSTHPRFHTCGPYLAITQPRLHPTTMRARITSNTIGALRYIGWSKKEKKSCRSERANWRWTDFTEMTTAVGIWTSAASGVQIFFLTHSSRHISGCNWNPDQIFCQKLFRWRPSQKRAFLSEKGGVVSVNEAKWNAAASTV